jgi:glutamyl-tRNA reductase
MDQSRPFGRPLVVGADHRTSSMAVRDRLFIGADALDAFYADLKASGVEEALVLSTGNRVEVQAIDSGGAAGAIVAALARRSGLEAKEFENQLYRRSGAEAVRHVFSVAATLDDVVIGETRLARLLEESHHHARDAGMCGPELDALLDAAYRAGTRVRRETALGTRPVSIGSAAVQIARDLHGDPSRCTCLLVGAGEMGELVAEALLGAGLGDLVITHPSLRRAEALGRGLDCHVAPFEDLADWLAKSDIVLMALNARQHSIDANMVAAALRRRRRKPIFIIDTGIPGDVEPAVERLEDAFLFDLDDLEKVAREGQASQEDAIADARRIVDEEADRYAADISAGLGSPALDALADRLDDLRAEALERAGGDAARAAGLLADMVFAELARSLGGLGPDSAERAAIERFVAGAFKAGGDAGPENET